MKFSVTWTARKRNFAPLLFTGNLENCFQLASDFGYRGIELSINTKDDIPVEVVIEKSKLYNMEITSIGTGLAYVEDGLSFSNHEERIREAALKRFKEQIQFAAKLDAPVILGLIHGKLSTDYDLQQEEKNWICSLTRQAAAYAAGLGVNIIVEPINRYETNYINTVEEALTFIQEVGASNLGIMVDTFHMNIEEKSFEESIAKSKEHLLHVHLADSNRRAPGFGHLDFHQILGTLKKADYHGFLSLECLPEPDSFTAAKKGIEWITLL